MRTGLLLLFIFIQQLVSFKIKEGELRVRPPGKNFFRALSSVVFTCEFGLHGDQNDGGGLLTWLDRNNQTIESNNKRYVEDDTTPGSSKLFMKYITEEDVGEYRCVVGRKSESVHLLIIKDIGFDDTPTVQHLNVGGGGLIRCMVRGSPQPSMTWRKNSRKIISTDPRFVFSKKGLEIINVTEADAGTYTCRAEVEFDGTYQDRRISVIVNYPPKVIEGIGQVSVISGSSTSISCKVIGSPAPVIRFSKISPDNTTTEMSSVMDVMETDEVNGTLTFFNVSKSDEGSYTCVATNELGASSHVGGLKVQVPPTVILPIMVTTTIGSNITISCLGYGDPMLYLSFTRRVDGMDDEYLFEESNNNSRINVIRSDNTINLTITNVNINDNNDNYICESSSPLGSSKANVVLLVQYGPQFPANQTSIVYGWGDKMVNLTCVVYGEPKVKVYWFKGHQLFLNDKRFLVVEKQTGSILQVALNKNSDESLYGVYTCSANNSIGTSEFNITLQEAHTPENPMVTLVRVRPNDIIISITNNCTHNPPFEISSYELHLIDHVNYTIILSVPTLDDQCGQNNSTTTTIENLNPNTSYILLVMATNVVGVGVETRIELRTNESGVPDRVMFNVTLLELNSVTLGWQPPYDGGSNIISYLVSHRKVQNFEGKPYKPMTTWTNHRLPCCHQSSLTVFSTGKILQEKETSYHHVPSRDWLTYKIPDLVPSTIYQVKVVAINSIGQSQLQPDFFIQTTQGTAWLLPSFLNIPNHNEGIIIIIIIIVVCVIIISLIIIIDISCYLINKCGITMWCCAHVCGKSQKHSMSPQKNGKMDNLPPTKGPPSVDHLQMNSSDETLDMVVIDNSSTMEFARTSENNWNKNEDDDNDDGGHDDDDVVVVVYGKMEESVHQVDEKCNLEREDDEDDGGGDGGDGGGDNDGDWLPSPPPSLITSQPLSHSERAELITPRNRRSIMNLGDVRWKDVVLELETQLGVKKLDAQENDEEEEDADDKYTGNSSPKWKHT